MLDYLVQIGEISRPDGLFATWFHRANSKEEMNEALSSESPARLNGRKKQILVFTAVLSRQSCDLVGILYKYHLYENSIKLFFL